MLDGRLGFWPLHMVVVSCLRLTVQKLGVSTWPVAGLFRIKRFDVTIVSGSGLIQLYGRAVQI